MSTSPRTQDTPRDQGGARTMVVVNETTARVISQRARRADTFVTRLVGLLARKGLAEDEALWILPCKGIHTMGMRFTIDAIFLDEALQVVALREHVVPWRATGFFAGAVSVLELPAGLIRRAGIAVGHQMGFNAAADHESALDRAAKVGAAKRPYAVHICTLTSF